MSEEKYLCTSCKIDLPQTNDYKTRENDLLAKFAFEPKVRSANSFLFFNKGGITQKLLHQLKYRGKKEIGILLGAWFAPRLAHLKPDLILPIPLHKTKFRKRTFNQSEKIAEGISGELDIEVNSSLVKRVEATVSQTRKTKAQRWQNMKNVYSPAESSVCGKSVLVVDDVITTGATVGMFCQRLVDAGVKEIHIASIARGK
jgi:ComF family protein